MRIAIIDDNTLFRDTLRIACTQELHHEVIATVGDGRMAVDVLYATRPELAICALQLPGVDGLGVVHAVRRRGANIRFVIVTEHCNDFTIYQVEKARVQGFIDRTQTTLDVMAQAIQSVAEGRTYYSSSFADVRSARRRNTASFDKLLSERELEVLCLLGEPLPDADISRQLGLSLGTVVKHRFNIMGKLGLRTRSEMIRFAQLNGFRTCRRPIRSTLPQLFDPHPLLL